MRKKSKSEVNYREAQGSRYCGNCVMYHEVRKDVGYCDLVVGTIYKFDLCDEWEPQEQ